MIWCSIATQSAEGMQPMEWGILKAKQESRLPYTHRLFISTYFPHLFGGGVAHGFHMLSTYFPYP